MSIKDAKYAKMSMGEALKRLLRNIRKEKQKMVRQEMKKHKLDI